MGAIMLFVRVQKHVWMCLYAHVRRTVSGCQGNVLIKEPNRNRVMDRLEWEGREREREKGGKHFWNANNGLCIYTTHPLFHSPDFYNLSSQHKTWRQFSTLVYLSKTASATTYIDTDFISCIMEIISTFVKVICHHLLFFLSLRIYSLCLHGMR